MHSLSQFVFSRVLNEDPILKTIALLGTLPSPSDATLVQPVILLIEKTHFATQSGESDVTRRISELLSSGSNDIYFWWNATLTPGQAHDPDLKMSMIFPASEAVSAMRAHSYTSHMYRSPYKTGFPNHSFARLGSTSPSTRINSER
jgi:m7GpppX diphosphatase